MGFWNWFFLGLRSFIHWVAFGIAASFIPFLMFINFSEESLLPGLFRVLESAAAQGEVVLLMIPLIAGLIGETSMRAFRYRNLEIITTILGIALLFLVLTSFHDFKSLDWDTVLNPVETHQRIVSHTETLGYFLIIYAVTVMFSARVKD